MKCCDVPDHAMFVLFKRLKLQQVKTQVPHLRFQEMGYLGGLASSSCSFSSSFTCNSNSSSYSCVRTKHRGGGFISDLKLRSLVLARAHRGHVRDKSSCCRKKAESESRARRGRRKKNSSHSRQYHLLTHKAAPRLTSF